MAELELRNLVKVYPFTKLPWIIGRKAAKAQLEKEKQASYTTNEGVLAIQNLSLSVEKGTFLVLMGGSGSGKSTLLRMICGLESLSAGEIYFEGKNLEDVKPEDRNMAMVFQNFALYPNLTVAENIAFPLKNQHLPRVELEKKVADIADTVKLSALLDRFPRDLSGGEMQRVAIARALVREPKLFLLDEPFSNLDPILRQSLRSEVKRLHQKLGITFIYVTHDIQEAYLLGERIVHLEDGMIAQIEEKNPATQD